MAKPTLYFSAHADIPEQKRPLCKTLALRAAVVCSKKQPIQRSKLLVQQHGRHRPKKVTMYILKKWIS